MSSNTQGFEYEAVVLDAIREAGFSGNILEGAGASAAAADADFRLGGKVYKVEVKLDSKAQMGGSSVRLAAVAAPVLVKSTGDAVEDALLASVCERRGKFEALLARLSELEEGRVFTGFPVQCSKESWTQAKAEGMLVNAKVEADVSFIAKHYMSKGVFYIQFGDKGLFHLGKNPANLSVPKLTGSVKIEVRTARGGSKPLKSGTGRSVTGAIRVQARLSMPKGIKSPFTLDDAASVRALMTA